MPLLPNRIVIHAKDIALVSGYTERTGRRILARIRRQLNLPPSSLVSVQDFCAFTGLKEEYVLPFLK